MITVTYPILKLGLFELNDQASFAIVDLSQYATVPSSGDVSLQITAPGYDTANVTFTPGSVNIYRCVDLNITCAPTECCPLPDGIYEVFYTVGTETLQKTFIKTDQIKCKFQNMFSKVDLDCNCGLNKQKQFKQLLKEIDLMIAGSVAAANLCDPITSKNLYYKADDLLDKICCEFGMDCKQQFSCPQCQ